MDSPLNQTAVNLALTIIVAASVPVIISSRVRRHIRSYIARWKIARVLSSPPPNVDENEEPLLTVGAIYIHPVKSLRPVSVSSIRLDNLGLERDRRFMVVRPRPVPAHGKFLPGEPTHRFLTQRQAPSLATVQPSLSSSTITLTSHLLPNRSVTVRPPSDLTSPSRTILAGIWNDTVLVTDAGDEAASFLRSVLERHDDPSFEGARLVSVLPSTLRCPDPKYVPMAAYQLGNLPGTGLTDGFPILVTCTASLEELNRRLREKKKDPILMSRFRPNIVIANRNGIPFEEDGWKAIQIVSKNDRPSRAQQTVLYMSKGCPRCKQSCTDQETGQVYSEPLETLGDFRKCNPMNGADVYFGQNAVIVEGVGGVVSVGDEVRVLSRGDPVWDVESVSAE